MVTFDEELADTYRQNIIEKLYYLGNIMNVKQDNYDQQFSMKLQNKFGN